MRRPPRIPFHRNATSTTRQPGPSFGFSGAGFLGCYHVGAAACLRRQGWLPRPDDAAAPHRHGTPRLTGVSAGSMVAAALLAGVRPDPDGMDVVLAAARRTRALARTPGFSLDVLTPGFSLIDQVEGPFRAALAGALGGYCATDARARAATVRDVDPALFARRFPAGALRIGLTDRRELWPPVAAAYRYVERYRDLEDVVACSMLSSYIPGITGPLKLKEKAPAFLGGLLDSGSSSRGADDPTNVSCDVDTTDRAGVRLKEMIDLGFVKHGNTGLPIVKGAAKDGQGEESHFWDGGLADNFPTFDDDTVIVTPLNGLFDPNPSISPPLPETDATAADKSGDSSDSHAAAPTSILRDYLRPYLPATFPHCVKAHLGLNAKNATAGLKMIISSDDDELYLRFREGYDDARRFLDQRGQLRVFSG